MRVQRLLRGASLRSAAERKPPRHAWSEQATPPGAVYGNGLVAPRLGSVLDALARRTAGRQLRLAVLAWYGVGRFFLEPLRERPDIVFGQVRINQVVAALLALGAGCALIMRGWAA